MDPGERDDDEDDDQVLHHLVFLLMVDDSFPRIHHLLVLLGEGDDGDEDEGVEDRTRCVVVETVLKLILPSSQEERTCFPSNVMQIMGVEEKYGDDDDE